MRGLAKDLYCVLLLLCALAVVAFVEEAPKAAAIMAAVQGVLVVLAYPLGVFRRDD